MFGTLVKFTTADVSLLKDVFDKAVKSALGRVNTHGISNLAQHQSKALLNFLCGKDSFVCLPTGHGKSLIKRIGVAVAFRPNFTSGLSRNRCEGLCECTLQCLLLWRNDIYFGQRRDKQMARETIICQLAASNFEDKTVSVQNIIYRMTAEKFEYETNSTQMHFVEIKAENVEEERDSTQKYF